MTGLHFGRLLKAWCGWSRVFGPEGQEILAQGLPWVLVYKPEALKGHLLTRRRGTTSGSVEAPSGLLMLGCLPSINLGLSSPGLSGQRPDSTNPRVRNVR